MMYQACTTPGIQPSRQRPMLMRMSAPQPRRMKTARGGRKMEMMPRTTPPWVRMLVKR